MEQVKLMKIRNLILILSFVAVVVCLVLTAVLFYSFKPSPAVTTTFTVGILSGACTALLVRNLTISKI